MLTKFVPKYKKIFQYPFNQNYLKFRLLETMLLQSSSHIPQLAAGVNSLLTRGKLLDMTLAAGGKSIKVHKVVMAAASKYFEVN